MKISPKFVNYVLYPLLITSCGISFYAAIRDSKNYTSISDLQKEIKQKDPARYDSLIKQRKVRSYQDWAYEAKIMNDSLKADSMAKRAYFEGAQMVRDSIKNTERVK